MNILKILTPQRQIGNFGEKEAVKYLRKRGYRILEKNYTIDGAEIDIIARRKGITVFIEVKTRNVKHLGYYEARPASSVTPEKQRKIIRAANHYITRHPTDDRLRLDIIEVYICDTDKKIKTKEIKHIEAAFSKDTAYDSKYYYQRKKEGSNL